MLSGVHQGYTGASSQSNTWSKTSVMIAPGHSVIAPPGRKSVTIGLFWPLLRYCLSTTPRLFESPATRPGVRK